MRVGILGGGQLAQMLVESGLKLGLDPLVYTQTPGEGAAKIASGVVEGSLTDRARLETFLAQVDVVVFESEFVDCSVLKECSAHTHPVKFVPGLDVLAGLRDKLSQKKAFEELGLPTARYHSYSSYENLGEWLASLQVEFPNGFVLKWGGMGYDGKGIRVVKPGTAVTSELIDFCEVANKRGVSLYAEEKIDFKRELALVACHSTQGEFIAYPLVLSVQWEGICDRVEGPATKLGVPEALEAWAIGFAKRLAMGKNIFGTFALELFETKSGELLINEMAPRVHNSGHYSQDACEASQFENHWRAVLGKTLGKTSGSPFFGMLNLLGPDGVECAAEGNLPKAPERGELHWYDKARIRGRRKVGHFNTVAQNAGELEDQMKRLEQAREEWKERLHEKR